MRNLDLSPLFRSTVGFDHLDKLFETAFRDAASQPRFKEFLASQGETLWLGSSDELRTLIRDEYKALGEVSQTLGLKKS